MPASAMAPSTYSIKGRPLTGTIGLRPASAERSCSAVSVTAGSASRMRGPRPRASTTARDVGLTRPARLHMDDRQGRRVLPAAAREVREIDRGRFLGHRLHAQMHDRAQRRSVVHVHVGRLSFAEAFDEPVVLDEVHPAVTGALRNRSNLFPERMLELLHERRRVLPLVLFAATLDVDTTRITLKQPLGALHHVDAAVGTRKVGAVLDKNRAAARGLDQAGIHVAEDVLLLALRGVGRGVLPGPVLQPARRTAHRDEIVETIAAIDVHAVCDRTEAV